MTPPCPPPEALLRLGDDALDADAFHALEAHVAACAGCQGRLDRLARLDTTGSPARPAADRATAPEVPGCVLGAELGRGGSGVVYEAFQPRLGRRVAVKVLTAGPSADARRRWLREARAIARVRHPNIVRLHDAGEHDGRLFLVLDLVPGGSLRDRAGGRPIPPRDAARLVEATAKAVEESHRAGVLHLDVKPSNILMDGPPGAGWAGLTPMLSDFGIARDECEETREALASGTIGARGTPAFMAPEQVGGRAGEIGPTADVYALGATLYALLTGRPPFLGASPIETMDLLRTTEPAPPRALAPGVPRDLETICLKALEKAPARRYASAAALADDLGRFRGGRPIQARPVSPAGRLARWCRRRAVPAALAATLLATILVALVALAALWRRSEAALSRAVQGESTAEGAVADLVGLLRRSVKSPERFASERTGEATDDVLGLTARLRRKPGLAARHAIAVADLEVDLSRLRGRNGDHAAARRLLRDADAMLADAIDRGPPGDDRDLAEVRRAEIVLLRGAGLLDGGEADAAADDVRLAERIVEPHRDAPRALEVLTGLRQLRGRIARQMPNFPGPTPADDPIPRLVDALERCAADWREGPTAEAWKAYEGLPAGSRLPLGVEGQMYDLAAHALCDSTVADVGDPARFSPEAVARRVLADLDAQVTRLRFAEAPFEEVLERLSQLAALQSVASRRAGRVDEARRSAAWAAALGREVSRRMPRSAVARLMICRALEQEAKIAWGPAPDEAAVERCLRAALAEASLALTLEPDREEARRSLAGLREKYLRLLAREPEGPEPGRDTEATPRPASRPSG